ncbi:MAG TPA: transaldolase [Armatimonadota bacterium]|jgi:transaldolase
MPTLHELAELGQSVWLDTLSRAMLNSGELQSLIGQGVRGVTANPTILDKAISGSDDYDADIRQMAQSGTTLENMYVGLVLADIARAADMFRPLFQATGGADGYVSLEVNPHLAHDTSGTIAEVRRLFSTLNRPNIFIKVPATPEGIPAIEQLISEGININVTLMFSLAQYDAVAEAYLNGLERLLAANGDLRTVASVASFFVSRIDTAVDKQLSAIGKTELLGRIAVANAKMAYARFRVVFSSPRWQRLAEQGAQLQRPLWASTGTKNPRYSDTLYVDQLIGPYTVNTMPLETIRAFQDHGSVVVRVDQHVDQAEFQLSRLAQLGIDLDQITRQLTEDGVALFSQSYDHLMENLAEKSRRFGGEQQRHAA